VRSSGSPPVEAPRAGSIPATRACAARRRCRPPGSPRRGARAPFAPRPAGLADECPLAMRPSRSPRGARATPPPWTVPRARRAPRKSPWYPRSCLSVPRRRPFNALWFGPPQCAVSHYGSTVSVRQRSTSRALVSRQPHARPACFRCHAIREALPTIPRESARREPSLADVPVARSVVASTACPGRR
jgi:hypothetical protein